MRKKKTQEDKTGAKEHLQQKLELAEAIVESIRKGNIDLIIGDKGPLLVRLKSLVEENERLLREWQKTFDAVPDSIMLLDKDQRVIRCNKASLSLFNVLPEEIIGKKCCEIVHKSGSSKDDCPFVRMCNSKKREQTEVQNEGRYYLITIDPIFNEQGVLEFAVHTISDITLRKKTESDLRLLGKAVEYSGVSIMITDLNGNLVYVNPGFTRITGYNAEEVIGENPRILKSGKQSGEFYKNLWDTILSGKTWEGELVNKKKNGELYWEKAVISPITDTEGKITHFVGVKEDITDREKMIEELINAKEKAEESTRLKSAFLANISHEIRTPLNGILGFAELLQNYNISDGEKKMYFNTLKESGQRLLTTINQIIEMSKIESGTVTVSKDQINLKEFLSYIYNFFKPEADRKNLDLILKTNLIDDNFVIESDRYKIESIITNLVKNAIKFTNTGYVELSADISGNEIVIAVKDTGIGISKSLHNSIFDRFVQADISYNKPYEGVGLGLSIASSYATILGGRITVDSEEGKGSIFKFTMPFLRTEQILTQNYTGMNEFIKSNLDQTILVAEDDDINFYYIDVLLKKSGYRAVRARNGDEAVREAYENKEISLILMDLKMPESDGYKAIEKIRQYNDAIPIIAQTAFAHDTDREMALALGCNDYISKPFTREELIEKINACIKRKNST